MSSILSRPLETTWFGRQVYRFSVGLLIALAAIIISFITGGGLFFIFSVIVGSFPGWIAIPLLVLILYFVGFLVLILAQVIKG